MSRIAGLFVVAALVAACGSAAAPSPTPTLAPTATPTMAPSASASMSGTTVSVGQTSLGPVLVAPDGHTLYGFTPDQAAGKPTCNTGCMSTWPPLTVNGTFTVGAGLTMANFTLVARDDGSMQLATGGFPLYEYAPDANPGDIGGQGLFGKWYAMGSNGTRIGAPGASAMPTAGGSVAPTNYVRPTPAGTY